MDLPGKPQGDPDGIHRAASAWRDAAVAIEGITRTLSDGVTRYLGGWSGPSRASFDNVWKTLHSSLESLSSNLRDAATRLDDYANQLNSAQDKYNVIVGGMAVTAVAGIAFTVFTLGASDAVAAEAVAAEAAGAATLAETAAAGLISALQGIMVELTTLSILYPEVVLATGAAVATATVTLATGGSPGDAAGAAAFAFAFVYIDSYPGRGGGASPDTVDDATRQEEIDAQAAASNAAKSGASPDTIDDSQAIAHERELGFDPAIGKVRPDEGDAGVRFEQQQGVQLTRTSKPGADWEDASGKTYDAFGTKLTSEHFNYDNVTAALDRKLANGASDYIVVDLSHLDAIDAEAVQTYISNKSDPRIIVLQFGRK